MITRIGFTAIQLPSNFFSSMPPMQKQPFERRSAELLTLSESRPCPHPLGEGVEAMPNSSAVRVAPSRSHGEKYPVCSVANRHPFGKHPAELLMLSESRPCPRVHGEGVEAMPNSTSIRAAPSCSAREKQPVSSVSNRHPFGRHPAEVLMVSEPLPCPRRQGGGVVTKPNYISKPETASRSEDEEYIASSAYKDRKAFRNHEGIDIAIAHIPGIEEIIDVIQERYAENPHSPLFQLAVNRLVYLLVRHVEDKQAILLGSRLKCASEQRQIENTANEAIENHYDTFARLERPSSQSHESGRFPDRHRKAKSSGNRVPESTPPMIKTQEHFGRSDHTRNYQRQDCVSHRIIVKPLKASRVGSGNSSRYRNQPGLFSQTLTCVGNAGAAGGDPVLTKHTIRNDTRLPSQQYSKFEAHTDSNARKAIDSNFAGHKLSASLQPSPNIDAKVCDTPERPQNDIGNEGSFSEESEMKRMYNVCPKVSHTPFDRTLVSDYTSLTPIECESDDSISSNTAQDRKE